MALQKPNTVITDGGKKFEGYINEERDCTVRALALAMSLPYNVAHDLLHKLGRRQKGCFAFIKAVPKINRAKLGYRLVKSNRKIRKTVQRLLNQKTYQKGVYIFGVIGHVFCVRDGEVLDSFENRTGQIVKDIWKVKENK